MVIETSAQKRAAWSVAFLALKPLLLIFSLTGLVASNIASVVSASAHDWMHSAIWRVASLGGEAVADRVVANGPKGKLNQSVKERTAELESRNKQLSSAHELQARQVDAAHAQTQKLARQLEVNGKQAKETVAAVHQRLARGISRNMAALPSEAVPYVGIGVALAVTSLDLHDACQTMKDFNALLLMMGQGQEHPGLCGHKVPTVEQVLAKVNTEWRSGYALVKDEAAKVQHIRMPDLTSPTWDELARVTCPVVTMPALCRKG